jgi:hypothetical protein
MTIPVFVLLGFAAWTMLTLIGGIGVNRWTLARAVRGSGY